MKKSCEWCGETIDEDANFCPRCGCSVNGKANTRPQVEQRYSAPAESGCRPERIYEANDYESEKGSNGMAIAGFICSFFIALLGLIFGCIGLSKSKECGSGRGLSIAAIVISLLTLVGNVLFVLLIFGSAAAM